MLRPPKCKTKVVVEDGAPSLHAGGLSRMVVSNWLEVGVEHGILGSNSLSMVVPEHLAEEVECLVRHQLVVLGVDKFGPGLTGDRVTWQQFFVVRVQSQSVLVQVGEELLSAENFRDLDQLIVVVASLEEGFTLEDHSSEHAAERPNVERVVVSLQVNEKLGSFEVAGGHSHVVLLTGMVKLGETPIDQT